MDRSRWREGELFGEAGASGDVALPPDTIHLVDLATRVHNAVRAAFTRRLWVVGEIAELERSLHKRHWFFKLCGRDRSEQRRYSLDAVLWSTDHVRLFGRGGMLRGAVEPKDGIEVRALVEVDFYPQSGGVRLVVREIDPAYTLGRLALERKRVIERLTRDGLLEKQKALVLTDVPLTVGLITSVESAAFNDFVMEMRQCGLAFRVRCYDARMQGEATVAMVVRGLKHLARERVDVIAVVRGGGSTVDLAWFDREEIAATIARCTVPVLTGIGHEIDQSVADLVAHRAFKTPTAVAAFLAERALLAMREIDASRRRLREVAARVARERRDVVGLSRQFASDARAVLARERESLTSAVRAVRRAPGMVRRERHAAGELLSRFNRASARRVEEARRSLARACDRIGLVTRSLARGAREDLARAAVALARGATRQLRRADERHHDLDRRRRLLDPSAVVRRGYAIVRDARGRVVVEGKRLRGGAAIRLELRDGEVAAQVEPVRAAKTSSSGPRRRRGKGAESTDTDKTEQDDDQGPRRRPRQLEIWASEDPPAGDPGQPREP